MPQPFRRANSLGTAISVTRTRRHGLRFCRHVIPCRLYCKCLPTLMAIVAITMTLTALLYDNQLPRPHPGVYWPDDNTITTADFTIYHDTSSSCNEKVNIVYIKIHKTGSETLSAIFRRFGYKRNLSFVLPIKERNNLGWPYTLQPGMYKPSKTGKYNIFCEHAIFNEQIFGQLMPNDTVYVTSVRDPFRHFLSAFYYFNVSTFINITDIPPDPLTTFLSKPDYYDSLFKSNAVDVPCVPRGLSVLRNGMALDLGFQVGFEPGSVDWTYDIGAIKKWLDQLEHRFHLVLLTDYMDESLVLLRRMLCWKIEDILYLLLNPTNWRPSSSFSPEVNSEVNIQKVRAWNVVDVMLYDRFHDRFWRQVQAQDDTFSKEVEYFRMLRRDVSEFCNDETTSDGDSKNFFAFIGSYRRITVTYNDCQLMRKRLMNELKAVYDRIPIAVDEREPSGPEC